MTAHLVMKVGGDLREIPLANTPVSIGREPGNEIQIEDVKSSRKHCSVLPEGNGYVVMDHESRNGTQVNGKSVTRHTLSDGDVIAIGKTSFVFHAEGADAAGAKAAAKAEEPPKGEDKWVLEAEFPDGTSKTIELGEKLTIGRNPKNTIPITDAKASNFHCEIVKDGPGYTVRDLNSTNGTKVDGKIVEELGLYHDSLIEVGKTRFTIRNLAIPDSASPFDSDPVSGTDFTSFSRKRRGFPVVPVLFLVLAAAALYGINRFAASSAALREFESPSDNLLKDNYSFEGNTDSRGFPLGFRGVQGDEDRIEAVPGRARSGKKSLVMERASQNRAFGVMEVMYGDDLKISQTKVYEISAFAEPEELKGVAGVKMIWLNSKNPSFRRETVGNVVFGSGEDFVEVKAKAAPPLGADTVSAACFVNATSGTVVFDDLQLKEAKADDAFSIEGEYIEVRVDGRGVFSVRPKGNPRDLLHDGQLILFEGTQGKSFQRTCRVREVKADKQAMRITVAGDIYMFAADKWVGFTEAVTLEGGEVKIEYSAGSPENKVGIGGVAFSMENGWSRDGVGLVTLQDYKVESDLFEAGDVTRMLWGRTTRPVSVNYSAPVTCMHVREIEQIMLLQLVPGSSETGAMTISFSFQTDFRTVADEIRTSLDAASAAEKAGRIGEAIGHLKNIVSRYPFRPEAEKQAAEALGRLTAEAEASLARIRSRFDLAQFFRNVREMEAALGDSRAFIERFGGSEWESQAADLASRIAPAIGEQRARLGQQEAEGFLLRAREHASRGEKVLAAAFFRHVVDTWPGSDWAKTATEEMGKLGN